MLVSVSVYEAACQSRFSPPEIIAILGDVVRRLRLLKGTKAAIGRRGFGADLQMLGEASVEDFMEALNIAKPRDSIGSACSRPGMPAKVKTALRTLLLSTSDVPGTEGRKTRTSLRRARQQSQVWREQFLRHTKLRGHLQSFGPPAPRGAREAEPP